MKNGRLINKQAIQLILGLYVLFMFLFVNIKQCYGKNINNDEYVKGVDIYKAIVIDAGSTGTRIHIYNYHIVDDEKGNIKIYIPSINYRTTPGLVYILNRYFSGEKEDFHNYFKNIKSFIYDNVEEQKRFNTIILFRASGGFRLLSINESEKYMNFLKNYFFTHFNEFLLIDDLLVNVLSGKEEAILSFVSIYALLQNFNPSPLIFTDNDINEGKQNDVNNDDNNDDNNNDDNNNHNNNDHNDDNNDDNNDHNNNDHNDHNNNNNDSDNTIGVLELGGATAQIVIKVPLSKMNDDIVNLFNYQHKEKKKNSIIEENYKNKNIVKINLFNQDIFLYCKSYLVLGRQNAMKTYLHYILHKHKEIDQNNKFIEMACFPKNFKFHINNLYKTSIEEDLLEYDGNTKINDDEYIGVGIGNINMCRQEIQTILDYAQIDDLPFKIKKFIKLYGIENFHHFAVDILNIAESFNPISLNTHMYLEKAQEVCPLTIEEIRKVVRPESNIEKAQTSCFGLIFLYEFMRYILKIDKSILFYSTNYINKTSITWTIAVLLMEIPKIVNLIRKNEKIKSFYSDEL
ncbi:adenosine-diphosphatase, putative [Plasmodium sp. gorilla clade G1]|nr:adenosine-diphosphatase, putative [Plasmodium sp. gorilla clade G1]